MAKSSKEDVRLFLYSVREAIDIDSFGFDRRDKNRNTLAFFGWQIPDMLDIIYGLNYGDYQKGPEPNRDHPQRPPYWFFMYRYCGRDIYIKISVEERMDGKGKRLFIKSFHIDDQCLLG